MEQTSKKVAFPLGRTVITANALESLEMTDIHAALDRHVHADWGDVCREDAELNNDALVTGCRVLSAYSDRKGVEFWIITEADRSATTVLLPDDY